MKLSKWLRRHLERQDPLGDFARDTLLVEPVQDIDKFERLRLLLDHMDDLGACRAAKLAAVQAWFEWLASRPKNRPRGVTPKLRYSILARDGFRCRACGSSPRDHGVKLHVDHVRAVANGGSDHPDNLQALCDMCNFGKGKR